VAVAHTIKGYPKVNVTFQSPSDEKPWTCQTRLFVDALPLLKHYDIAPLELIVAQEEEWRKLIRKLRQQHGFPPHARREFITISDPIPGTG
jgi:hypothetical protein